jgi:hypothetical protein
MRPIDRGNWPTTVAGTRISVNNYRNWRGDQIDRIGSYCSFCNMTLTDSPQVEHVIAQDIDAAQAFDWDNLLLACGACNRAKSNHPCPPTTHYLPTDHNTHLAFDFVVVKHPRRPSKRAAFVTWKGTPADQTMATNTIKLCKLAEETTRILPQFTDQRWDRRFQAYLAADIWRRLWEDSDRVKTDNFIEALLTVVKPTGFWSIWYDTFSDVQEIRKALVQQFPGTNLRCFDPVTFEPVPLNAGGI